MNEEEIKNNKKGNADMPETTDTEDLQNDDVEFEEVNEEGEVDARDTIKKLRAKIKALEKESKDNLDGWTRAKADYANFKREVDANRKEDIKFANKKLVLELLPVLDAYDMARGNEEAWNKVDSNWRIGIEYIFNQLTGIFEKEGIIQFGKVGETFDPNLHESIELIATDDKSKDNTIAQVLQKGYKIGEVILRPARIKTFHVA